MEWAQSCAYAPSRAASPELLAEQHLHATVPDCPLVPHAEEAPAVRGGGTYRGGKVIFTRLYVSLAMYHSNQTEGRGEGGK